MITSMTTISSSLTDFGTATQLTVVLNIRLCLRCVPFSCVLSMLQDLENAATVSPSDPAYSWAYAEVTKLLQRKKGQHRSQLSVDAPNPTLDGRADGKAYGIRKSIVALWDPETDFSEHVTRKNFRCIRCNSATKRPGRTKLRRVCGLHANFYFCGVKYKSSRCQCPANDSASTCFDSKHSEIISRLPEFVKMELPVILTPSGAIDRKMLELINHDVLNRAKLYLSC